MGWARTLFLGDIGNRLDIADTERDIAEVRREIWAGRAADQTQDQLIRLLQQENAELEVAVAMLVRLLERKGVLTADEVNDLVMRVEG